MNPRILYLKLIFLPYIKLCITALNTKYFMIINVYLPVRRLKNTLKFMLKLRIKCGIPLHIGWESAQDMRRNVDREEL